MAAQGKVIGLEKNGKDTALFKFPEAVKREEDGIDVFPVVPLDWTQLRWAVIPGEEIPVGLP